MTHAWGAENNGSAEKASQNSTNHPKQINTKGEENPLFGSVDWNIKSNEAFQSLSDRLIWTWISGSVHIF